jgi:cob(I)alamin adenosyltransferase
MSIATKTGDAGETALMYGRRVPKTDPRVIAYGCVDELNASLGLARATTSDQFLTDQVSAIQNELIVVMGELATAAEDSERYAKDGFQLTTAAMVDRLTAAVDDLEKNKLGPLKGWSLPGGSLNGAALDLARTVCRRAERQVVALENDSGKTNAEIVRYLNRLSDLCWLLARYAEGPPNRPRATEEKA